MQFITACIDKNALIHNIKHIKSLVPQSNVIAVVKANAYGHGAYAVANTLKDYVQGFAVARISEAMELRKDGITKPIFLLEGFYNEEDVAYISRYDLYTAVHELEQIEAIEKANIKKPIHVWLQVDVGMHRLGSHDEAQILKLKARLEKCKNVVQPIGLLSHLSVADTPSGIIIGALGSTISLKRFLNTLQAIYALLTQQVSSPGQSLTLSGYAQALFSMVFPHMTIRPVRI